jgi:mannosyltransferase
VKGRALLLALLVLGLAAFWRLHGLSRWSLDGDELYSHYAVVHLGAGEPADDVRSYPLGFLLMGGSVKLLGGDELGLRAASALCGLLAIAALLLLRRDRVSPAAALVAAALAALSPWLIYHSQEARFYAPLLLFATLATLWALPGPGQRPWLALLCGALAAACHPSALLVLPLLAVAALRRWLSLRSVLILAAVAAVAGAAWLLLGSSTLPRLVQEAVARRALASYDLVHFVAGLGYAFGPATLLLVAPGAWRALREPQCGDRSLLALAAVPTLLLLLLSLGGASVQQRYAMAAVPAALLLAGRGFEALARAVRLRASLLALALLAPAPQLWAYAQDGDRSDWRGAAEWIAGHAQTDDILLSDEHALLDLYLPRQPGWESVHVKEEAPLVPSDPDDAKRLWSFPRDRHEVWVVLKANHRGGAYGADFEAWLAQYFELVAQIGVAPPPLTQHDNRLQILRRKARVVDR